MSALNVIHRTEVYHSVGNNFGVF